jgi:ATP/maltotriose-dependent transcriptional regulator MalT
VVTTRAWLAYLAGKRGDIAHATELLQTCFEFGTQARDTRVVFHCTNITLWLMAGMGEAEAVARLLGVQRALLQRTGFTPGKWSQNCSSDAAALVQSRLAPAAFERAVAAGRVLTDEQVAGLATELLTIQAEDRSQAEAHAERPRDSVLSDREHEVLHLVAEGLSNKLIGKQLFISPNTVSYHVTSIFNKLGVDTRAQAVAVAGQRSLL